MVERVHQTGGEHLRRRSFRGGAADQDGELIPAEPDARRFRGAGLLDAPGGDLQHVVARRVPLLVVDPLEMIEVDQQQRVVAGVAGTETGE